MYNSKETTLSNHYMPDFSDTNEETKAANIAEFLASCEENGNPILFVNYFYIVSFHEMAKNHCVLEYSYYCVRRL